MKRKNALSGMGYAIVLVIILGIVMIASAPMLANKYGNRHSQNRYQSYEQPPSPNYQNNDYMSEIQDLRSRIDAIENNTSDRYICKIKGYTDEQGNELPAEERYNAKKFIFVCEYKNR